MPNGKDIAQKLRELYPDLPPEALLWLSQHPETIQWPEPSKGDVFWQWVEKTYAPEQVAAISEDEGVRGTIWQHYVTKIADTQWDVGYQAPERGRPQPEKYGINETDWLTLEMLAGNPAKLQRELETWIGTGYISQVQARDIWDEVNTRVTQAATTLMATGYTEEEWPAEHARRLKLRETARKEVEVAETQARWRGIPLSVEAEEAKARSLIKPFTEYGAGLERIRTGFAGEVPQTERWQDWFRSRYPRIIEQFEVKPEAERTEKGWAEYLKRKKPEIKEQYYKQTPYERGERPSAFAPRIQTVGF